MCKTRLQGLSARWLYPIEFKTLLYVFKGPKGMAPVYITEMFIKATSTSFLLRSSNAWVKKVPKFNHNTF